MTSRERARRALEHQEPDRVPLDLGAYSVTGMHVNPVYKLRQAWGLDSPGTPVKFVEPTPMLAEIAPGPVEAFSRSATGASSAPCTTRRFGSRLKTCGPSTALFGMAAGIYSEAPARHGISLPAPPE